MLRSQICSRVYSGFGQSILAFVGFFKTRSGDAQVQPLNKFRRNTSTTHGHDDRMHLTSTEIADLFKVTDRTVRHWHKYGFPSYAMERLSLINGTHPDWPGFSIGPGYIWTPGGKKVLRNEIDNIEWFYQAMSYESKLNNSLSRRIPELEVDHGITSCEKYFRKCPTYVMTLSRYALVEI